MSSASWTISASTPKSYIDAKSRSIGFNSDSTSETQLISDLSDYFDVELINRFSQKYTFSEISRSVYRKIVEKRLASEIKVIKRLHPELNMDSLFSADELAKAVDKITADTYNIKSGACFCKCQEQITIIFILLLACFDFGWQTNIQVSANGLEIIKNINKPLLYLQCRYRNRKLI